MKLLKWFWVVLAGFGAGCVNTGRLGGSDVAADGSRDQTFGGERLIVKGTGNIADRLAMNEAERMELLTEYLRNNRSLFGGANVAADMVEFGQVTEQQLIRRGDGLSSMIVLLYQQYMGANIIDRVIFGGYRAGGDGAGELFTVRAQIVDPSGLPMPPEPSGANWTEASNLFLDFLEQQNIFDDSFEVDETPVISQRVGQAGFLARIVLSNEDGSRHRIEAIVNPDTDEVIVLDEIPACQAHNPQGAQS